MSQDIRRLPLLCLLTLTQACPQRNFAWIEPGSTREQLTIVVSAERKREKPTPFIDLIVYKCGDADVTPHGAWLWQIIPDRSAPPDPFPTRVIYGIVPKGFTEEIPAAPLGPGCYVADPLGAGRAEFLIDSTGAVQVVLDARVTKEPAGPSAPP